MTALATEQRTPLVQMNDIRVAFGGVHAVDGVSVDLFPGEVVALVGGNGAGKTTLIKTLSGAHKADSGEILGLHLVGNGASDLISEGTLAIEMGAVLHDLSLTIHPHPTLSEGLMESAKHALGEAIHMVNR